MACAQDSIGLSTHLKIADLGIRVAKMLDLCLREFAYAEETCPGGDLISERLANLSGSKG